eukprot:409583-Rhodomonas_salina.3
MKTLLYSGTSGWLAYLVCRVIMPALGMGFIKSTVAVKQDATAFQVPRARCSLLLQPTHRSSLSLVLSSLSCVCSSVSVCVGV